MIHARPDYNRIQDPALTDPSLLSPGSTPIGEDEPVILFRAQDKYFQAVLRFYHGLIALDPVGELEQINAIQTQLREHDWRADTWQGTHPPKSPDVPL